MRMIMETGATRSVLQAIIQRDYEGSQTDFSQQCGLNTADTSRVIAGVRPATLGFVRRATAVLEQETAAELITAFLSDVLSGVTDSFSAVVTLKSTRRTALFRVSDEHHDTVRRNETNTCIGGESLSTRTLVEIAGRRSGLDAARCRLVFAHLNTATLLRSSLHKVLVRHQLSDLQFAALVVLLALEPEPIPIATLAEHTAVSRSAMTDALDKLEALGFATRSRDRSDRRVIYVRISSTGRETVDQAINDYLHAGAYAARYVEDSDHRDLSAAYLQLQRGATSPDELMSRREADSS